MSDFDQIILKNSDGKLWLAALNGGELVRLIPPYDTRLGEIHLGIVRAINPAMKAAFIEIEKGDGFLPLATDQKLFVGEKILVQVDRDALADKQLRLRLYTKKIDPMPDKITCIQKAVDPIQKFLTSKNIAQVYVDSPILKKTMQDLNKDFEVVYEKDAWKTAGIDDLLAQDLAITQPLPNGGQISIEITKACLAIDVDLAGHQASTSAQARLEVNRQAVLKLARLCSLRNLGGLMVVDFLRMPVADAQKIDTLMRTNFKIFKGKTFGWSDAGLYELALPRLGPTLDEIL